MANFSSLSAVPHLLGAPRRAFEIVRDRPGWISAFALGLLIVVASFVVQLPQTLRYQAEVTRATMERFDVPEEEIQKAIDSIPDPQAMSSGDFAEQVGFPSLFLVLPFFLGALVLHLLVKAFGATTPFRSSLGVLSLATLPNSLGALLKSFLARATDTIEVALSPLALFPGIGFHSALGIALDSFDAFSILSGLLVGLGVHTVMGLQTSSARIVALVYWTLGALVVFLLRFSQSWFSGSLS